jgi:hypothetical protein
MKGMPYFKSFVLGLLGLNLTLAAATLTATALPWGFVIALAVTLGLAIVVLSFKLKCGVLFFAGIYACFGSVLTGMYARNYIVAKGAGIIEGLAVTEALNRPQAGGYIFRDGLVRADLRGSFFSSHRGINNQRESSWYYVAPVVPEDWTPSDPVTVWAACGEIASCTKNWAKPFRAGVRLNAETTSMPDYRKAAADAESRHGIRSHSEAIFMTWVENPRATIEEFKSDGIWTAKIWNIVWLTTVLLAAFIAWKKKRRAESHPGSGVSAIVV